MIRLSNFRIRALRMGALMSRMPYRKTAAHLCAASIGREKND